MAARQLSGKKPKHLRYTLGTLLSYMGRHKLLLLIVAILVTISALANLLGTYMIRPIVNNLVSGDVHTLILGVAVTARHLRTGRPLRLRLYTDDGKGGAKDPLRYPAGSILPSADAAAEIF